VFGLSQGEAAVIHSRLPGVNDKDDFIRLVRRLRDETGVPVGLKIAATHHLEKELAIAAEAGVDFITVDGAEGGTHGGAPPLQDDVGLPTLFAVTRAHAFLAKNRLTRKISLLAAGGLTTPGSMLKALALGADAVYIGTAAIMAMISDQITETMPFEPPTSLVVYTGKMTDKFDVDAGAQNLFRYLNACVREMEMVAMSLGKTALSDLSRSDLCTLDPFLSKAIGIELGWVAPERQRRFFREIGMLHPVREVPDHQAELPLQ